MVTAQFETLARHLLQESENPQPGPRFKLVTCQRNYSLGQSACLEASQARKL
jgi:hypothetical protein